MRKYLGTAIWVVAVALATLAYVFADSSATLAVMTFLLALPIFFLPFSILSSHYGDFSLNVVEKTTAGDTVQCVLTVNSKKLLPIFSAYCEIKCVNKLTLEESSLTIRFSKFLEKERKIEFSVASKSCGQLEFSVKRAFFCDPIGILPIRKKSNAVALCVVFPTEKHLLVRLAESEGEAVDEERQRLSVVGTDPTSGFGVREYMYGDSVRNIHWKLSEKIDKTMVRELTSPISDSVLLLVNGSDDISGIATVLWAVIRSLAEGEVPCELLWFDANQKRNMAPISCRTEAETAISALLGGVGNVLPLPEDRCSHTVIFGDCESCAFDGIVTVIRRGRGNESRDGVNYVGFSMENFESDLGVLTI